jgi:transposase
MENCVPEVLACIDSVQNVIIKNVIVQKAIADSAMFEALKNPQEIYNTSFVNMQNSFSSFITMVGVLIGVLSLFTGFVTFSNFKYGRDLKEELKKQKSGLKEIKEQSKGQKSEIENQKNELKNQKDKVGDLEHKLNEYSPS